jgi:hypothetical protein
MICPDSVDLFNLIREGDRLVNDELKKLMWCRFASEKFKLVIDCATPRDDHSECDLLWGTSR